MKKGYKDEISSSIVDLTLPLKNGMPAYPSSAHVKFHLQQRGRLEVEGRRTSEITIGSHQGTHIDAPSHFLRGGKGIDEIPLTLLVGPAWLLDLSPFPPGRVIEPEDLASRMPNEPIVRLVLRTDWDRFWGTEQYFCEWPRLSPDSVNVLIEKKVQLLGMDFPSPEPPGAFPGELDCPLHKLFFRSGVILIEYLSNLRSLMPGWFDLIALPLPLVGSDGSPARVIGIQ